MLTREYCSAIKRKNTDAHITQVYPKSIIRSERNQTKSCILCATILDFLWDPGKGKIINSGFEGLEVRVRDSLQNSTKESGCGSLIFKNLMLSHTFLKIETKYEWIHIF